MKPERATKSQAVSSIPWWHYFRARIELYEAIARLDRCIVTSQVTKHLCFSFQPTDRIFSHKLNVFPLSSHMAFALLQSRVHVGWAWLLSSTMKNDLNYSATDCFETFPFPDPDPHQAIAALEDIGEHLYEARASYMVDTDQGLTKTYNHLKDPDCHEECIEELRRLHEEMDRAVIRAYHESTGDDAWAAIEVPPYAAASSSDRDVEAHVKALERFNDLVIDRLFVLNAERADEERKAQRP